MSGSLYTLGYLHPDATTTLMAMMASDLTTLLVDIRYSPRSRWSPQWSKMQLQATWGDRYPHVKALGNMNYHLADAPIQLLSSSLTLKRGSLGSGASTGRVFAHAAVCLQGI
jgi:Domain of unknown function DUF488